MLINLTIVCQHNVTINVEFITFTADAQTRVVTVVLLQIAVIMNENCESNLLSNLVYSRERGRMIAKMFRLRI